MSGKLIIYTDGGCRHNPGPAAIGVVIQNASGITIDNISRHIGPGTNNQAEYRAVIAGLEKAKALGADSVEIRADSQLIVEQLNGRYKVKEPTLKPLFQQAYDLSRRFKIFRIVHIPREMNREADKLASQALDHNEIDQSKPNTSYRQSAFDI